MGNSLHGIRIGFAEISNFMIYYRVSRFAYLRMSCGCKTFLKLMINNNFEDQDLLQGNYYLLFLSIVNAVFENGFYLYFVSCYFTIKLCY